VFPYAIYEVRKRTHLIVNYARDRVFTLRKSVIVVVLLKLMQSRLRMFSAVFLGVLLRILTLVLGFEPIIATDLMAIVHKCKIGRGFIRCEYSILRFTKADIACCIKFLAKSFESEVATLKYLAYRRRFKPFLMHVIRFIGPAIRLLVERKSY